MQGLRHHCFAIGCSIVLLAATAAAQTPAPVTPPQEVTTPVTNSGSVLKFKDLWFEIVITLGMGGLALFAVCRSSPRN
ncbi:MAG: hypothetical protein KDA69_10145 [Planctomycetaceae bacterium]|nr:hypothetical protein [Planctomycetaceae bacterium]MCA9044670.1 hypothetical protein [Planctomycetaceae bacterium]